MRLITGVFLLACVLYVSEARVKRRTVTFTFHKEKEVSWLKAMKNCESKPNRRLGTIRSSKEHDDVLGIAKRFGHIEDRFWVGGTDLRKNGTVWWLALPDEHFVQAEYINWHPGYPRSTETGCVLLAEVDFNWVIEDCARPHYYICEEGDA